MSYFESACTRSSAHELLTVVELHTLYGSRMATQAHEAALLADRPQVHLLVIAACHHDATRLVPQRQAVDVRIVGNKLFCKTK